MYCNLINDDSVNNSNDNLIKFEGEDGCKRTVTFNLECNQKQSVGKEDNNNS